MLPTAASTPAVAFMAAAVSMVAEVTDELGAGVAYQSTDSEHAGERNDA
jgi:hypothetical protein